MFKLDKKRLTKTKQNTKDKTKQNKKQKQTNKQKSYFLARISKLFLTSRVK